MVNIPSQVQEKKEKPKRFTKTTIILIALVLSGAGLYALSTQNNDDNTPFIDIERVRQEESLQTRLKAEYQPNRQEYGYGEILIDTNGDGTREKARFWIADVAKNLCEIPEDFWLYKYQMMTGQITPRQLGNLSSCYYEQPEWIRDNFKERMIDLWYRNPDPTHWTPEGYGTYPHEINVITTPGDQFDLYTFFHTSYGVERYQGVRLKTAWPTQANNRNGTQITINPEESQKYIKATIQPNHAITSPTYPIFEPGWMEKINLNIRIANNTPKGYYAVGFNVAQPETAIDAQWRDQYGPDYQPLGNIRVGKPQFKTLIQVI